MNTIEGFEEAGIVLWNLQQVKTKKLFPSAIYEKQESFPHVKADESRENIMPGTSGENEKQAEKEVSPVAVAEKEVSPQKQAEKIFSPEVAEEKPMVITVGKKKFKLVKFNEAVNEKTRDEKINDILSVPKPKIETRKGGCRVPGLPRCVSSQEFWDRLKAIEDAKKAK